MREFEKIIKKYISPVLIMYTNWIISEAEKRGIKRLYFFARDGWLMYHIAARLCKRRKNGIICSYFYCSRYALRMAAYRFFDDCAYEKLFINAYSLTAKNMLERAGFEQSERELVYADTGFAKSEEYVMGRDEFLEFCKHIRSSIQFVDILKEKSDSAYTNVLAYIRQEGLQNYNKIGIVDLGWTGSLQYTLRRILNSAGIKTKLVGFYMGMLDKPPTAQSSEYLTWLFNDSSYFTKSWFAHNLMECICSAPHGMTVGYTYIDNKIVPTFAECENNAAFAEKIKEITLRCAGKSDIKADKKEALRLLWRLMFMPTETEARALSVYSFCDDVGEQYHRSIVQSADKWDFRKELLFFKAFNRDSADGFYWYCGSVAASDLIIKTFYRYEYLITKYLISKLR